MTSIYESRPIVERITVDVLCDHCGSSCQRGDVGASAVELAEFTASWGYCSNHDAQVWHADLCHSCAEMIRDVINAGAGPGVQTTYQR